MITILVLSHKEDVTLFDCLPGEYNTGFVQWILFVSLLNPVQKPLWMISKKCVLEFSVSLFGTYLGTSVIQVTATDADDANYGNSAKVVYSILQGQPYFSVDPETGEQRVCSAFCNDKEKMQGLRHFILIFKYCNRRMALHNLAWSR